MLADISHGGYYVSPARVASMPEPLREFKPWAGDNWYEEDCDWCIVALAFPQFFPQQYVFFLQAPPVRVDQPIDLVGLLAGGHHPAAGAIVLFSGEVRESNQGKKVAFLEYEAHVPLAEKLVAEILAARVNQRLGTSTNAARSRSRSSS